MRFSHKTRGRPDHSSRLLETYANNETTDEHSPFLQPSKNLIQPNNSLNLLGVTSCVCFFFWSTYMKTLLILSFSLSTNDKVNIKTDIMLPKGLKVQPSIRSLRLVHPMDVLQELKTNPTTHRSRSFMYNVQPWLVVGVGWHLRINTSLVPKKTNHFFDKGFWAWTHGSFHRNLFGAFVKYGCFQK